MKEILKSALIGVAAIIGLIVWLQTRPQLPSQWQPAEVGKPLFPEFQDPSQMRTIRITRRTETGELKRLELTQGADRLWYLARPAGALADNSEKIASITSPLLGLSILAAAPKEDTDHSFLRACALLDPTEVLSEESPDAGILLEILGDNHTVFARMIIGKEPPESSAVRDIRYLRKVGEDEVVTVDFSSETAEDSGQEKRIPFADRLSIEPLDWMKTDLLRISRWKIASLKRLTAHWDGTKIILEEAFEAIQDPDQSLDRTWTLTRKLSFRDGAPIEEPLEGEQARQLTKEINPYADHLSQLTFTDLTRFPPPLDETLNASTSAQELVAYADQLAPLGFRFCDHDPLNPDGIDPYLTGVNGETTVTMTDGTIYRILYGTEEKSGEVNTVVLVSFTETLLPPAPEGDKIAQSDRMIKIEEGKRNAAGASKRLDGWLFKVPQKETGPTGRTSSESVK